MDDDRLRRELQRRATRAAVPDFASEVAPRLGSDRAQPARVARWAPLAGLAAAAVIVVVVVIAFPRSPSTPAASITAPSVTSGSIPPPTVAPYTSSSPLPPSPSVVATQFDCTSQSDVLGDALPVGLVDRTGLVVACDGETDRSASTSEVTLSADKGGDLVVTWPVVAANCTVMRSDLDFSFGPTSPPAYTLAIRMSIPGPQPTPGGPICDMALGMQTARITLSESVTAAQVHAFQTIESPLTVEPTAISHSVTCSDVMTLTDATGDVVSCTDAGLRQYRSQDAHISVDAKDRNLLHVWWGQSNCTVSYELSVTTAPATLPQPADYDVTVFTTTDPECQSMPDAHAADIEFASPIDAGRVRLHIDGHSLADPVACVPSADLADAGNGVDIYDSTDLITGCTQRQPTSDPTGIPSNVTDSSLVVTWSDRPCGVPIHLMFDTTSDGYALSKPGQCMVDPLMTYEVVISFVQPVSAQNVAASIDAPLK